MGNCNDSYSHIWTFGGSLENNYLPKWPAEEKRSDIITLSVKIRYVYLYG